MPNVNLVKIEKGHKPIVMDFVVNVFVKNLRKFFTLACLYKVILIVPLKHCKNGSE